MLQYKSHSFSIFYLLLGLICFIPSASFAADYSHGDACSTAGAFHQTNDSSGLDFLICDGSNWKSALFFSSTGNNLRLDNDPAAGSAGCIKYDGTGSKLQFAHDCSAWMDFGGTPAGGDREIQFNSGGAFATDSNFVFTSAGRLGIGTNAPNSLLNISKDYAPAGWNTNMQSWAGVSGSSATYNGVIGLDVYSQTAVTGAGTTEAFAIAGRAWGANDAKTQYLYGVVGSPKTFDTDVGYALVANDHDDSTGGTIYGLRIDLNNTNVTRWGVYQVSDNPNYFKGPIGINSTNIGNDTFHIYRSHTIAEDWWHTVNNSIVVKTGDSASYNGFTAFGADVTNNVTGAGQSDARGYSATVRTANDSGDSQEATALFASLQTHPGDIGRGVYIRSDGTNSTGGTQYGVYININDADVTRYGIYQATANDNYFAGNIGIGDSTPETRLEVDGTLQLAYSGEACDAAREGSIHYKSSDDKFYLCATAGSWEAIGGGSGSFFESTEQTITLNSSLTLAHGLGTVPELMQAVLVNKTTQHGYSPGDEVVCTASGGADPEQCSIHADATNVYLVFGKKIQVFLTNGSSKSDITTGNWKAVARAWTGVSGGGGGGGGTPAGANTQIQFNDGGSAFGGDADFVWNKTTNKLTVTGDIDYTGVITDISDRRLKENITPLANSLEGILGLQGYSFTMKGDESGDIEYGLIAQEVQESFPYLVKTKADGTLALNYMGLSAPLIEAIKEQQALIESQAAKIETLVKQNEAFEARLKALEEQ